jgi:hypothetical protein
MYWHYVPAIVQFDVVEQAVKIPGVRLDSYNRSLCSDLTGSHYSEVSDPCANVDDSRSFP